MKRCGHIVDMVSLTNENLDSIDRKQEDFLEMNIIFKGQQIFENFLKTCKYVFKTFWS